MKSLLFCICAVLMRPAFVSANQLNDVIRGRAWKELDTTSKAVYIKSAEDCIVLLGSANPGTKILKAYDGVLLKDVEQIEASVNKFYADEDNINISVVDALLIISDYLEGMPRNKIDAMLAAFRRQSLKEVQNVK